MSTFTADVFDAATGKGPKPGALPKTAWPKPLAEAAYHGPLGAIVRLLEPETEADPVAVLLQLLVMFGNVINRSPCFCVGTADVHHLNLFAVLVGATAKGRKGMSRNQAQQVYDTLDEHWVTHCITTGLSSGEGLIWAIRDAIRRQHPIKKKGRTVDYETVIDDHGIDDKRLLVVEAEFAQTLKVMAREGNTLSPVIRQAWDGYDLRTLTKTSSARATAPHISIVGHVTSDELRRYLEVTETANGFGNRFLWALVRRSRELPRGGQAVSFTTQVKHLQQAIDHARRTTTLKRNLAAEELWDAVYGPLSAGRPGMLGAMTARAEAQVMRLAALYALADVSATITPAHLRAALAVWQYCFASAVFLFGDRIGDPVADAILSELRRRWPERMTKTDISGIFHRHKDQSEINRGLDLLVEYRRARVELDRTGDGRPVESWFYVADMDDTPA